MALVGRIARAHGIRGQVIVNPETDFPEDRFRPGAEVFINRGGAAGAIEKLTLTTARLQNGRPVIGVAGIDTMNDAQTLAGQELRVPVEWLAPLPEGTFYRHDLIGCRVETAGGDIIGVVDDVEGTLTGSRLVVKTSKGNVLIPLVGAMCTAIEPAAKRIVVDLPDGLLDVNT